LSFRKHISIDVGDGYLGLEVAVYIGCVIEHPKSDIARSASHIEDIPRTFAVSATGIETANKVILPQPMNSKGHEIIHGIIG
jgi:hypothetical protein